jgi:hypothetical protein
MLPSRFVLPIVCLLAAACTKDEFPCGISPGCTGGSCDVSGGPDEVCTDSNGRRFETFCNLETGRFEGGAYCDRFLIDASVDAQAPDAAAPDAAAPDATTSDATTSDAGGP